MPIFAPESKKFPPAAAGEQQGVIAKVVDLGMVENEYKGKKTIKPNIKVIWQVAEKDEQGQPKRVSEFFVLSDDDRSNLYKRIMSLFGQPAPKGFDYDKLVGTNRNLLLTHNAKGYAVVSGVIPLKPGQAKLEIVPFEDKQEKAVAAITPVKPLSGTAVTAAAPITDEDIPF